MMVEWAGKPNSVHPDVRRDWAIIDLGRRSPAGSSTLPTASDRITPTTVTAVTAHQSIRETGRLSLLIWACWRWGLPCHDRHRPRGALLPHHFTLTGGNIENPQTECDRCNRACAIRRIKRLRRIRSGRCFRLGGVFSVALSLGSRRVGVTNHRALSSPDFPPANQLVCGRSPSPASSFAQTPIRVGPALRDSHAGGSSSRSNRHD